MKNVVFQLSLIRITTIATYNFIQMKNLKTQSIAYLSSWKHGKKKELNQSFMYLNRDMEKLGNIVILLISYPTTYLRSLKNTV